MLGKETKKYIQQVLRTFLYYVRAVDPTMLVALSAIASEQASPTQSTMKKVDQFLDYAASQEQSILTYEASDMVLAVHSNASYLSESKARSRAGGHFFHVQGCLFIPQQWSCAQHSTDHENNHVLGSGSRNWVHVCQCMQSCPSPKKPQ